LADSSPIEWTDSTWNPVTGCTKVSPGCKNCYAERLARRLKAMGVHKYRHGFGITVHEETLDQPLRWHEPRMIFVNSMSDLFHEALSFDLIHRCFEVMEEAEWHTYQVLTKRPQRMLEFATHYGRIPAHIWLGTSVELPSYKSRIDLLRQVDVPIRFVSFEPLLGDVGQLDLGGIAWAIVGGESGPHHRAIHPDWVRGIRDQCIQQSVRYFFKQWGGRRPKSGGRLLDGRTWDEYPEIHSPPQKVPCYAKVMRHPSG
jgi:protein gp37